MRALSAPAVTPKRGTHPTPLGGSLLPAPGHLLPAAAGGRPCGTWGAPVPRPPLTSLDRGPRGPWGLKGASGKESCRRGLGRGFSLRLSRESPFLNLRQWVGPGDLRGPSVQGSPRAAALRGSGGGGDASLTPLVVSGPRRGEAPRPPGAAGTTPCPPLEEGSPRQRIAAQSSRPRVFRESRNIFQAREKTRNTLSTCLI